MKNVTSRDPRKPAIVAAFKRKYPQCVRLTCVRELPGGGGYRAHVLVRSRLKMVQQSFSRLYASLGDQEVTSQEVASEMVGGAK